MSEQPTAFEYRTTGMRALLAFAVVVLACAALVIVSSLGGDPQPGEPQRRVSLADTLSVLIGLIVTHGLVCPLWWKLDSLGHRGPWTAAAVGAGAGAALTLLLAVIGAVTGAAASSGLSAAMMIMVAGSMLGTLCAGGAAMALLGWRIAYRKTPVQAAQAAQPGQAWLVR